MIGYQFKPILEQLCPKNYNFLGVFSYNEIPDRLKIHSFFVFNTAHSHLPGQHWIICFKSDLFDIEIYDALGCSADYVKEVVGHLGRTFHFLTFPTQPQKSKLCGEYCIYYIVKRLFNVDQSFEEVINEIFCRKLFRNELRVKKFIKENITYV